MIQIRPYNPELKYEWDEFVSSSRNGTFILKRDFMEYHSDRFKDDSLLFYTEDKLIALLPANSDSDTLYSHTGLTYGSFILTDKPGATVVMKLMEALLGYLKNSGYKKLIYKPIPYIYHKNATEEDLYALFRFEAKLIARCIASCMYMDNRIKLARDRKRALSKSRKSGLIVEETNDFSPFWDILAGNLNDRYKVKPVHNISEITYLKSKFPGNIRLFCSYNKENELLAGVVIFETDLVAHVQYISSNSEGRSLGAVDIIFNHLFDNVYKETKYFDFGISTENGGRYLNETLIAQKEGFGGRGIVYDTYEIEIK